MSEQSPAPARRLFVNGEALRLDGVEAPRSGGGAKYDPVTPQDARTLLLPQAVRAEETARHIPLGRRLPDRVYLEARLLPNYLAPSHFPTEILTFIGASPVGSRADVGPYRTASKESLEATRRLVLSVTDIGLRRLTDLIQSSGGATRSERDAFDEIRRLDLLEVPTAAHVTSGPDDDAEHTWEAVLHPAPGPAGEPRPLDREELAVWAALVERAGGRVVHDFVRTVAGLTFAPVVATRSAMLDLANFNALRVIRPMPAIPPRPRFGLRSAPTTPPPATPRPVLTEPEVAVFDGGVDTSVGSPTYLPVVAKDLTSAPPDQDCINHGTGVTAAVTFGLVQPGETLPQPPLPVTSYRVLPPPPAAGDLDGYWVLDQIKATVATTRPQIVNLSLGPETSVEDDHEPNRWTAELDQLAWENDVLFVVAAGNNGQANADLGLHRVQVPADMANGLSVGACDKPSNQRGWSRAPYSAMGPGRAGNRVQPMGVQFGGVDDRMFPVMRANGTFLEATGTSFAAPVTTHALADLVTRLPHSNPSVLRAFAVHFCERHSQRIKMRDQVGHGRQPLSFVDHLDTGPRQTDVLFTDTITRGDLNAYQLPIPVGITGRVTVRMTLAFASPVQPQEPTEYTSATLDVIVRPHQFIHTFNPPPHIKSKAVKLDYRTQEARDLIADGWKLSQEPAPRSIDARVGTRQPEHELREAGKWETVRSFSFSCAAQDLHEPRVEISYVSRRSGLDTRPTTVPYALVVSVTTDAEDDVLYEQTAQQFAALRPVARARGRARLRSSSSPRWY